MRFCLCFVVLALTAGFAADVRGGQTLRGKIVIHRGQPAAIETADHKVVTLEGDEIATKVLGDQRLNGFEVEAHGKFTAPDHFLLDGSHHHSLLVHKDGKLKLVSYWCDVCSIRAYTPGPCVCCQGETTLDLIDPDHPDHD